MIPKGIADTGSRRERVRQATRAEIKEIAGQQLTAGGAGALSLRAIGRAMGMSARALYRYYRDRDDLVTDLIVDAYDSYADALEAAARAHPGERLIAVLIAYREWAVVHEAEFWLIYGRPIPGYHAPLERIQPAARRIRVLMTHVVEDAWRMGSIHLGSPARFSPVTRDGLEQWRTDDATPMPQEGLTEVMGLWAVAHGMVMAELNGQTRALGDPAELYRCVVLRTLSARFSPLSTRSSGAG